MQAKGSVPDVAVLAFKASDLERERPERRLVRLFLESKTANTRRAYGLDLWTFASFVGVSSREEAAVLLLSRSGGAANALVLEYRTALVERGLSPATVNRRLAAVRSLVDGARLVGMVAFSLDVPGLKSRAYRDTRGPARATVRDLLAEIAKRTDPKGRRDYALVRLLYDLALRREEAVTLDLADLDLAAGSVAVLGKGRAEREPMTLPEPTKAALVAWLAVRGDHPGRLFTNLDRAGQGTGGLSGRSVHRIVRGYGLEIGATVRPHGLRHSAITNALDVTNGNLRSVRRFSRHLDVRTVERYDDNRTDEAGRVARLVAGTVE